MSVPEGFHVELVASEPDLQNPVAMAFDDRGRIYVTESFEYPRREPGPGRDRIKILEDKDGDGVAESVKVFAEGLNIPSGIAVGHGGVWVANAPDILFLEDTDGDDVADKKTVVVTGFGRDDTHELPNALTWGPDGCLYGLNGVFNPSKVTQDGKTFDFTCAMFRIDPKTKKFDLFCEGTSNPWGIAFDHEGSAFISACVIDHLWHLTESAYYLRQGGPYPPHTFYAESIVKHQHQMAAYCGIEFLDTDAYPAKFNNKLYMGNIHGGCINSDSIERNGATYRGTGEPDFLSGNDVWFMPVAQKVGPDGCLYILDWYDRYHCYQDANADPKGVDRGHGRLYRVVHNKRPKPRVQDFSKLKNEDLTGLLQDPNIFNRQRAQLELQERNVAADTNTSRQLESMIFEEQFPLKSRLHALWSLTGSGMVSQATAVRLLQSSTPEIRAWGVRTVGRQQLRAPELLSLIEKLANDSDPRVRIEVIIAAPKLAQQSDRSAWTMRRILDAMSHSSPDPITSRVAWKNMLPILEQEQLQFVQEVIDNPKNTELCELAPRFASFLLSSVQAKLTDEGSSKKVKTVLQLAAALAATHPNIASSTIAPLLQRTRTQEIQVESLSPLVRDWLSLQSAQSKHFSVDPNQDWSRASDWSLSLLQLELLLKSPISIDVATKVLAEGKANAQTLKQLVQSAAVANPEILSPTLEKTLERLIKKENMDISLRDTILDLGITNLHGARVESLLSQLPQLPLALQASIAERLCQRPETAVPLLQKVVSQSLRKEILSPNRIRLLAASDKPEIKELVSKIWGSVSTTTSKEREEVVQRITDQLKNDLRGNAERGQPVFDRICGQCHVMHGKGYEVGPNITTNGRGSFEQLIVSVFHPSLVIGEAYKSVTLRTQDDEVITGLLIERNEKRTVIKLQGGKERIVLAEDIDQFKQDTKSLMPEGIELQLSPQELADLFALLSLENPPGSKENATIPGTPPKLHAK